MSAALEVVDGGHGNTVQDAGRPGWQRVGVPVGGALDTLLLACANALVGNRHATEAIEIRSAGPRLRVAAGSVDVALAGDIAARVVRRTGSTERVAAWRGVALGAGDTIEIAAPRRGIGYLAVAGGIDVPACLGSRSTYAMARLGGLEGGELRRGQRIVVRAGSAANRPRYAHAAPLARDLRTLRVVFLGPQDDHFESDSIAQLSREAYRIGNERDRMGVRLEGKALVHRPECGADIVSDGTAPGAIQVPASGQPIVLMADCQTVGGYAKIATAIRADLMRFAHAMPGESIAFAVVSRDEAHAAWLAEEAALKAWLAGLRRVADAGRVDAAAILGANIVDGVVARHHATTR